MFTKFKSETQTILLDPDLDVEVTKERVAVILSPSLYWVRRFDIPTKNEKEAQKLLPSLFEDFLPEGDFRYYGYFIEEGYIAFAYEERKIRDLLSQKNIDLGSVEAIYFAQNEFSKEELPIALSGDFVLEWVDGIVLKLPFTQKEEKNPLLLDKKYLSARSIKIERYDSPIEKKTLYFLCVFFIFFALSFAAQWLKLKNATDTMQQRSQEVFEKYSLLPTTIQNKAILKKLESIDTKQKRVRRIVAVLLKLPQRSGGYLEEISMKKQTLHAVFADVKHKEALRQSLNSFKPRIEKTKGEKIAVELAL